MREFKYGVGVIATIFLLNLLLVKLSEKSSTKTDFRGKNQKDMSHDGTSSKNSIPGAVPGVGLMLIDVVSR